MAGRGRLCSALLWGRGRCNATQLCESGRSTSGGTHRAVHDGRPLTTMALPPFASPLTTT